MSAAEIATGDRTPLARALATMEKMKERIEHLERAAHAPIAIIGIGCRFPGGGRGPEALWQLLHSGTDAVRRVPAERWELERYYDSEAGVPGKMYTGHGSFLDEVDAFDADLFGISPREAMSMDPQQRIFLETSWEAAEHAGFSAEQLEGTKTGVYAGIVNLDYAMMQMKDTAHGEMDTYFATGHPHCVVSGRVAYQLGLRGPTLSVDTACSSSLVALHLACQALRRGDCEMAFAGGINLLLMPEIYMIRCQARMLSPSNRCATFDATADGYIPGEGCGVVLLKRLSDAQRDGDRIEALIRGTQINHDGRSNGLTVPSGSAQREVLRAALRDAHLEPRRIGYLEAHGTGTKLGDPIEMAAIQDVYCEGRDPNAPLYVGSAKTNFGHLESAAGICGLIKAVLAVQRGVIPPHLHFTELNPHITLRPETRISTEAVPWPSGEPRCAAVSSFGMSGTNAHAIVEEAPRPAPATPAASSLPATTPTPALALLPIEPERSRLVALNAQHPEALREWASRLSEHLGRHPQLDFDALVETLGRRGAHRHRLVMRASSTAEVRDGLASFLAGRRDPRVHVTEETSFVDPKVVFVFPGQGSQWVRMGCRLLELEPVFAAELRLVDAAISKLTGWSVLEELRANADASRLGQVDVVQPCIFAMQVGLARLWRSWGVEPSAVIGHSMGEVAAAHVAGILTLDDAARIVTRRSLIAKSTSGNGAMALVELSYADAERAITHHRARVAVAAQNGPHTVLLSGSPGPIAEILRELEARDVFCRAIKVDYASHSPQMDELRPALRQALAEVRPRVASLAFHSTVTGRIEDGAALGVEYWIRNLRDPVQFWPGIERLAGDGHDVFLEISPHPVLVPTVAQGLQSLRSRALTLSSLHREKPEEESLFEARAHYLCAGGKMELARRERGAGPPLSLPSYPFRKQRHWYTPSAPALTRQARGSGRLLHRSWSGAGQHLWECDLSLETMPSLRGHQVNGMLLFPGAGHIELALEAAQALAEQAEGGLDGRTRIDALEIREGLVLREDQPRLLQIALTSLSERAFAFTISSRAAAGEPWTRHADGALSRISADEAAALDVPVDLSASRQGLARPLAAEDHYLRTRERGLEYGPAYQAIAEIVRGPGEALATLRVPPEIESELSACVLHPSLLDAGFQLIDAALDGSGLVEAGAIYLPSALRGVLLHRPARAGAPGSAHLKLHAVQPRDPAIRSARLELRDEAGAPILTVEQFEIRRVASSAAWEGLPSEWFYRLHWQPLEIALDASELGGAAPRRDESWLIFADVGGLADALADRLASSGVRATLVRQTATSPTPAFFRELFSAHPPHQLDRILYAWGRDASSLDDEPDELAPHLPETEKLVSLVQELVALAPRTFPRLWLLTSGALAAESERPSPLQAPLWAMARVLEYEHPELKTVSCDLDTPISPRHLERLTALLLAPAVPDQLRVRADGVDEARLTRVHPPRSAAREERVSPHEVPVELSLRETAELRLAVRVEPTPHQLEVQVTHVHLARTPGGARIAGAFFVGTVARAGAAVASTPVGAQVLACAGGEVRSLRMVTADAAIALPAGADPAHLLLALGPKLLARRLLRRFVPLAELGSAGRSPSLLLLGGDLPVVEALTREARSSGARVLALTASAELALALRAAGAERAEAKDDPRGLEALLTEARPLGVDAIVHATSPSVVRRALELLRPEGVLVDLMRDGSISPGELPKAATYAAPDLAQLYAHVELPSEELLAEVAATSAEAAATSAAPAPTATLADVAPRESNDPLGTDVSLLRIDGAPLCLAPALPALALREAGSYLVTGGLGGLGLEVARFLVDHGVRHLVLLGRSRPSTEAELELRALRARGVEVKVFTADVAHREALRTVIDAIQASAAPLRGVVHCAGVLRDGALVTLDREHFRTVLESKLTGTWNLHALTLRANLEHFVMFSSVSSMLGAPGQGNYAAANAFLDGLAAYRQRRGLPALAVQWGAFRDVGLAAAAERRGDRLADNGIPGISARQGMKALELALRWGTTSLGVFPFPFAIWRKLNPQIARNTLFAELRTESRYREDSAGEISIAGALAGAVATARRELLEQFLKQQLARVLKIPIEQLRAGVAFKEMGFDSLIAIELRNRLEAGLELSLSSTLVWRYPTLDELSRHLLQLLDGEGAAASEPSASSAPDGGAPARGTWLVRERPRPAPRLRLLCFPHGGAGASAFQGWSQLFPDEIEICTFQPPGREERLREEPERSMAAYTAAIADELMPMLDAPFAVFGYSLGGLTGFATLAELRRRTGRSPLHLIVSSCFAPHIPFAETTLSQVSTQQSAMQAMAFYQSTPDSIFRDPEMQVLLQRSMDADNSVVESYRFSEERPLDCPITVYAGCDDDLAPLCEQQRWRELTTGPFELHSCEGDHFFFLRDKPPVMNQLRQLLASALDGARASR